MYTFDQLRSFIAVAEEMHFGRAAQRLNMTQPPLSRQIQALEKELGAELVDRSQRAIRLTAAGQVFLREARRLLANAAMAAETTRRTSLGIEGSIHLGFTSAVGHAVLPELLQRLTGALPRVQLILHEMVTADQIAAVHNGEIDIGMVRPAIADDELSFHALPTDRLVIAVPSQWGVATSEPRAPGEFPVMPLSAVHDRDFVMYSPDGSRYFHELLSAIFNLNQVRPRYVQNIVQIHTMLSLVDAGLGAALIPASASKWTSSNTVLAEAPELAAFPTESALVWRTNFTNPALASVLNLVAQPG